MCKKTTQSTPRCSVPAPWRGRGAVLQRGVPAGRVRRGPHDPALVRRWSGPEFGRTLTFQRLLTRKIGVDTAENESSKVCPKVNFRGLEFAKHRPRRVERDVRLWGRRGSMLRLLDVHASSGERVQRRRGILLQ